MLIIIYIIFTSDVIRGQWQETLLGHSLINRSRKVPERQSQIMSVRRPPSSPQREEAGVKEAVGSSVGNYRWTGTSCTRPSRMFLAICQVSHYLQFSGAKLNILSHLLPLKLKSRSYNHQSGGWDGRWSGTLDEECFSWCSLSRLHHLFVRPQQCYNVFI